MINALITLELLLSHDKAIEITRSTILAEKEDENVTELNFLCDS
jgi:hypothetical protein